MKNLAFLTLQTPFQRATPHYPNTRFLSLPPMSRLIHCFHQSLWLFLPSTLEWQVIPGKGCRTSIHLSKEQLASAKGEEACFASFPSSYFFCQDLLWSLGSTLGSLLWQRLEVTIPAMPHWSPANSKYTKYFIKLINNLYLYVAQAQYVLKI